MTHHQEDAELVVRVQRGERAAFDVLVLRYQQKVMNLVLRYVRDRSEAEDVTQEAFLKAYRALPTFRGESAFYTWLYRIAINTAKNSLVANKRRSLDYELDALEGSSHGLPEALRDQETPERLALSEEIRGTVSAAMAALPADLRTAIVLREIDGLSYEEIASTMDCPVGTVRSRIFRARDAIDRQLRPLFSAGLGRGLE